MILMDSGSNKKSSAQRGKRKLPLEEATLLYAERAKTKFSLEDAIAEITQNAAYRSSNPDLFIKSLLDKSDRLGYIIEHDLYVPLFQLLPGMRSFIQLTETEVNAGIMIGGHRTHLFEYDGNPLELSDTSGNKIEFTEYADIVGELMIYYSLLPRRVTYSLLQPISGSGKKEKARFISPAYDIGEFIKEHKLKAGAYVEIIVSEPNKAQLVPLTKKELLVRRKEIADQDRILTGYLLQQTIANHPRTPIKALLNTLATMENDGVDWRQPTTPYGPFLNSNKKLHMEYFQLIQSPVIVPAGEKAAEFYKDFHKVLLQQMGESCESLDDLFRVTGLSLNQSIVRGFIIDHVENGDSDPAQIIDDIFSGLDVLYWNDEHWDLFKDFFSELFEEVKLNIEAYTPIPEVGKLRRELLAQIKRHLRFLRSLDKIQIPYSKLPQDEMLKLVEIDSMLVNILRILESFAISENSSEEITATAQQLERVYGYWETITQKIKKDLKVVF